MLLEFSFKPRGLVGSPIRSFTLFGAICWGIRYLYSQEELERMLLQFAEGNPPFILSSPIMEKDGKLYFPKPQITLGDIDYCDDELHKKYNYAKKLKGLRYVKEEVFKRFLDGEMKSLMDIGNEDDLSVKKDDLSVKKVIVPHASINRITNTTVGGEYYTEEAYQITPFKVFVRIFDERYKDMVASALRFAPLGKNKGTGFGLFEVSYRELENHWILDYVEPKSNQMVLLSESFYDQDYDLEGSLYDLLVYMGSVENYYERITRVIWKRRIAYLVPGSVVRLKKVKKHYGGLEPALTEGGKKIYQYGYAFGLFVRENHGGA